MRPSGFIKFEALGCETRLGFASKCRAFIARSEPLKVNGLANAVEREKLCIKKRSPTKGEHVRRHALLAFRKMLSNTEKETQLEGHVHGC